MRVITEGLDKIEPHIIAEGLSKINPHITDRVSIKIFWGYWLI